MQQKFFTIIISLFVANISFSQNLSAIIEKNAAVINDSVIAWRRYIHQNPELSNREFKTSAFVAAHLKSLGIEVKTGIAHTGVIGILKGSKPGPVVALRADMDGLPVTERVNIPFASTVTADFNGEKTGVMHACGHDTHIAILLGTANVLAKMKNEIEGTVVFLFQPAEEAPPANEEGGAGLMVKEGALDNPKVDAVFGLHINAQTEIGTIKYKSGAFMASTDEFTIKIKGKQTHGSQPWGGVDPIVTAAQIINSLQTIVSRSENIIQSPVVVSVGAIKGGLRFNIIPEECTLTGTIRTLDNAVQKDVHQRLKNIAAKIAEANGATAEVNIKERTLVTYNNPELVKLTLPSLQKAAGINNVKETVWTTGGEDFSYYGEKAPCFFFNLGGMPKGMDVSKTAPHHTPDFYVDDSMLYVGVKAFCNIVFDYAKAKK